MMKLKSTGVASLFLAILVSGCATTDQQVLQLQSENHELKRDAEDKIAKIRNLTDEKSRLETDLAYCTKRTGVLEKEKTARIDEAGEIRKGVRQFTDQVITSMQTYFERAEIVDYLGGELFARASVDVQKNTLLVDLRNPVKESGTIIGGRAYVTGPTRVQFCLIRPDDAKTKFSIVAITPPAMAADAGLQSWTFDVPMSAKRGDLIAVYLPDDASIPYDDADTGQVVTAPGPVKINGTVALSVGAKKNRRAYSFGVVGYFDAPKQAAASERISE
ncbi:MAG: hypothetical protein V1929_11570 [bacterium]